MSTEAEGTRAAGRQVDEPGDPIGTILRIARFAIHDGPGIRTTVFLKGCPLRCAWCHSPESQRAAPEFMPQPDRCIRCGSCTAACPHGVLPAALADSAAPAGCTTCGACVEACPTGARELAGHPMTVDTLVALVERDRIFYDESGGGVTFSGGEPLLQPEFVLEAAASCRAEGIHVAVDTCGHVDPDALLAVAREADLFLFDLKTVDEAAHRRLTGVPNDLILSNLERLAAVHPRIIVRFPLIPGVNDDEANVRGIGALLASYRLTRVDVLPYHRAGLAKYHRLQQPYALEEIEPPSPSHLAGVVKRLAGFGLIVGPS
ncbi:MAG TPA: glycyl-radical enzyme activating protein [Vicinamibacterales bacterium]|nr:glycyl-radical enzyme activating protein [Acidobacteriota bacterium]HOC16920.1 glycyl-radical enzyme activating protein [Vicinamibacterales bacterium]